MSERIGYERGEYRRQGDGAAQRGVKEDGDDDGGDGWIGEGRQEALPAAQLTGESVLAKEEGTAHEALTAPGVLALALVASLALVALGSVLLVLMII